jgi:hypothetical protein
MQGSPQGAVGSGGVEGVEPCAVRCPSQCGALPGPLRRGGEPAAAPHTHTHVRQLRPRRPNLLRCTTWATRGQIRLNMRPGRRTYLLSGKDGGIPVTPMSPRLSGGGIGGATLTMPREQRHSSPAWGGGGGSLAGEYPQGVALDGIELRHVTLPGGLAILAGYRRVLLLELLAFLRLAE